MNKRKREIGSERDGGREIEKGEVGSERGME